ncbi:MAG: SGNH/GDSL hydrolase family protein [Clostridia bacterium]|nr:SGNH/GDSL hydrolase family protein [Clostridia bacterium]
MQKLLWKMILATLCLSLLCMIGVSATEDAPREIYVRTGSSGNGTEQSPVGTLTDAIRLLDGKGGTVILLDSVTAPSTTIKEQSGDLTITAKGGSLVLAKDLTFEKNINSNTITIDCPITVTSASAAIFGGFNSIVFTENVTVGGKLDFYGGSDAAINEIKGVSAESIPLNEAAITELPYSITVNGGTFRIFAGGCRRTHRTAIIGSVADDLTVTINGGTFGEGVSYAANSPIKTEQAFSLSGMSILAANATLTVNGGTFNVPVYAQGHMGEAYTNASSGSQVTKSDKKYYAIDGDISIKLNGGTFNCCEISAFQNSSVYTQLVRGNFTLEIGEDTLLTDDLTLDATQVKAYDGKTEIATLTYPTDKNVTIKRFDVVNGEAVDYEEPLRIACVGDSITQGTGSKDQETEAYPGQLLAYLSGEGANRIGEREVIIGNYGCGDTRVMDTRDKYYTDMLAFTISSEECDPDLVIIGLGTNDSPWLSIGKGQIELFREEYTKLLNTYGNIPNVEQVYCTTATYRAADESDGGEVDAYAYGAVTVRSLQREVVAELANAGGKFTCIDLYALSLPEALDGSLLSSDNLHPDTAGYTVYMHKVADAILDGKCTVENFEMADLYVSANGTNNAECTNDNPTNNLSIAFAKAAPTATIHIVDSYTYTLHGERYCIVLPAIDSLTIVGDDKSATLTTNCKYLLAQSDVTFDNLTLTTTASGAFVLQMGYNNATLTETFSIPTKHSPMFVAGFVSFAGAEGTTYYNTVESISSDENCVITLLGGTWYYFLGGNFSYEAASPIGTYSGNMTLNISKNVVLPYAKYSNVVSGICGMNYLTGTITANVASWANAPIPTYANRGATYAANYEARKNTGTVTVNLAEGMTNSITVMGDFDGDGSLELADVLYLLKAMLNKNMDKPEQYYAKTSIALLDVVSALKKLAK